MRKDDSGFAFPSWDGTLIARIGMDAGVSSDLKVEATPPSGGMTLRDYFAGQALEAVMSDADHRTETDARVYLGLDSDYVWQDHFPRYCATLAYDIADAMLKARAEGESSGGSDA